MIPVSLNSAVSSTCVGISISVDLLIEAPEVFGVTITTTDTSVDAGMDAQVTIGDSNMGEVLVSLDRTEYQGSEEETVSVCLLVQSSSVTDITRSIILRVSTRSGTAQGNVSY